MPFAREPFAREPCAQGDAGTSVCEPHTASPSAWKTRAHGPVLTSVDLWSEEAGGRGRAIGMLRERIARIEGTRLHGLEEPISSSGEPLARASPHVEAELAKPVSSLARHGLRRVIPLGAGEADAALSGGFPADGLTEIHVDETRGAGSGAGFALSLAVLLGASARRPALWIGDGLAFSEAGLPYLPGLLSHGLDLGALLLVRAGRLEQALWAGEEAARSSSLSLVILEVRGNPGRLSLEGTRRLHFRAREAAVPVLLLRQGGQAEPTAAPFRLRIGPEPAATVPDIGSKLGCRLGSGSGDDGLIGHPVFRIDIEKSPNGRPASFCLEWNPHDRRFQEPAASRIHLPAARPPAALSDHGGPPSNPFDRPHPSRAVRPFVALQRAS
ncbi:MAG: hypothetical protein H7Y08_13035 [Rhizobiaceae bacterium]|nr:hypothetical protein [Rhizobiaceae bacterium]